MPLSARLSGEKTLPQTFLQLLIPRSPSPRSSLLLLVRVGEQGFASLEAGNPKSLQGSLSRGASLPPFRGAEQMPEMCFTRPRGLAGWQTKEQQWRLPWEVLCCSLKFSLSDFPVVHLASCQMFVN